MWIAKKTAVQSAGEGTAAAEHGAPVPRRSRAVEAARAAVLAAREQVANWESRLAEASAELSELEQTAGESILADPAAADAIESRLTVLRSTVRAAERAVDAARPKVTTAESRYLTAEAAALEQPLAEARTKLTEHEERTAQLLAKLEDHEGVFVPESEVLKLRHAFDVAGGDVRARKAPKSLALRREVRRLEDQITILREMAAGRDPREWERQHRTNPITGSTVEYPGCVAGPDALVPTRAYLDSVDQLRSTIVELERLLLEELPAEIEAWRTRAGHGTDDREAAEAAISRREQRLAEIPAELEAARRQLAELEGHVDDESETEADADDQALVAS